VPSKRRERNPADGHSPITERDRRDARFRNTTSKPPRTGRQIVGPAAGIARSNLGPGESVFDGKPRFDRGRFVTVITQDYTKGFGGKEPRERGGKNRAGLSGAQLSATCEGASCGGDASTKITGAQTGYEHLIGRARRPLNLVAATVPGAPPNLSSLFVVAITNHKSKFFRPHKVEHDDGTTTVERVLFVRRNGRKLQHIGRGWFADDYPWRWDQPASCYLDVRIDGKGSNSADLTWPQAAGRMADETLDNLSTRPNKHRGRRCPLIFYEKPFLCIFLFWLMAGLDAPLSDFWFFVAEPPNTEKKPRRHIPSQIYC
jgi:hypothetical protein